MKFCRGCKADVPKVDFGNNRSQKDGLHWNCKACAKIAAKASRARRKARKLAEAEACRDEHLKGLSSKQLKAAEELRQPRTTHSAIPEEPKSVEMCQTYVTKLRAQRRGLGSSFPRMTQESLDVWESRLRDLVGEEEFDTFIKDVAGD